jgi:putative phage-type endonuclease
MHPQVKYLLSIEQPAQRTPAWYEMRSGLLTASNVAAALGIKPYESYAGNPREDLIRKMVTGDKVNSPFLQHGVDFEDETIAELEKQTGEQVCQVGLFVHPVHTWLGGSPDGLTVSGACVEAKAPQSRQIVMGEIPEHYYPQVQVCMEICNLDKCYFIEYKPTCLTWPCKPQVNIVEVARDRQWFADNLPAMHACWLEIKEAKADPEAFWASRGRKPPQQRAQKTARTATAAAKRQKQVPQRACRVDDTLYACLATQLHDAVQVLALVFPVSVVC